MVEQPSITEKKGVCSLSNDPLDNGASLHELKGSHHEKQDTPTRRNLSILKQTSTFFVSDRSFGESTESTNTSTRSLTSRDSVRFSDCVDVKNVPRFPIEEFSNLFYEDEEIAQFRYEAFCEDCGFDPKEFQ